MAKKKYDLVLFGATSFVGQILTAYLANTAASGERFKWAIAGRNAEKLEQVKKSVGQNAAKVPVIVADAADNAAMLGLCEQAKVVVSTVGPYALFGEPLIKACVATGTDYCDLTGEVQWIRRMIHRYEREAKRTGARIVHCCGFDSIPSDLGTWFIQSAAREKFGAPCQQVKMRVKAARGEFSGGTVASLMNVASEAASDKQLRKELANPYSLCGPANLNTTRQPNVKSAEFDPDFDTWLAPFVMAAINTRIVQRSNMLGGYPYGQNFQYDEAMITGKGAKGWAAAQGISAALGGFLVGAALKPSRWVLEKFVVPAPGEGPSPEAQKAGFYDLRFFGKTEAGDTLRAKVTGDEDPGYGSTSKMLGQAALCLAKDVPADAKGGFWTPASLMAAPLLTRLERSSGLSFELI